MLPRKVVLFKYREFGFFVGPTGIWFACNPVIISLAKMRKDPLISLLFFAQYSLINFTYLALWVEWLSFLSAFGTTTIVTCAFLVSLVSWSFPRMP